MKITTYNAEPEFKIVSNRDGIQAPDNAAAIAANVHFSNHDAAQFAHVTNETTGLNVWFEKGNGGTARAMAPAQFIVIVPLIPAAPTN